MPVTTEELASFAQFASDRIQNGGIASLEDCLSQWREYVQVNQAIDRGLADVDAGRFRPADEFWREFCDEHGIVTKR